MEDGGGGRMNPLAHVLSEGGWWWFELSSVASKHDGGVLVGASQRETEGWWRVNRPSSSCFK